MVYIRRVLVFFSRVVTAQPGIVTQRFTEYFTEKKKRGEKGIFVVNLCAFSVAFCVQTRMT